MRDNFKLIDVCRHSEKTWYQANWFTVNVENVETLWNTICQNQQIDLSILNTSNCPQQADHIKDFSLKDFPSQQHVAVEFKKSEEVEQEDFDNQVSATHFVEEIELVNSTNEIDSDEDNFSTAPVASNFQSEDCSDDDYAKPVKKSIQPSHHEVQEVLQQLRDISCTPQFRLNSEIQRTVKRCWENVPGAMAQAPAGYRWRIP